MTTDYGKERASEIEALDLMYPYDQGAHFLETGHGGLLLMETALSSTRALKILSEGPTSHIRTIFPVDALVPATINRMLAEIASLMGNRSLAVEVRCRRRGASAPPSTSIESDLGSALVSMGHRIDLEKPQVIARIDIIGGIAAISVRAPEEFVRKPRGCEIAGSASWEGKQ